MVYPVKAQSTLICADCQCYSGRLARIGSTGHQCYSRKLSRIGSTGQFQSLFHHDSSFSDDNQKIHCVTPCLDGSFSMEVENAFEFLTVFRNCGVRVKTVSISWCFIAPLTIVRSISRYRWELGSWRELGSAINHRQDTPASDLLRSKFLGSAGVYLMGLIN